MSKMLENTLRLEDLRLDNNLKQRDVAAILKVKVNTYSKWENCINDMPIAKCSELAHFYHVSLDYLLGLSNYYDEDKSFTSMHLSLLPQRMFKERKKRALTQKEVGKKIGFTQRAYSNYETGLRLPTTLKLLAIAQFYQVSFDYLVGKSSDKEIKKKVTS